MVHSSYAETGGAAGNPALPRPSPVRYLKFSLVLSDNLPDSYGSLFIYTLALHCGNTLCSRNVRASPCRIQTLHNIACKQSYHARFASALLIACAHCTIFFRDTAIIFRKLLRYARLIIHFFFRKIISEITSRRTSSEVSSAYTPTMPHCNR